MIKSKDQLLQMRKSGATKPTQENKIKWEARTMSGNFFEEIGKRISKFVSMKQNK